MEHEPELFKFDRHLSSSAQKGILWDYKNVTHPLSHRRERTVRCSLMWFSTSERDLQVAFRRSGRSTLLTQILAGQKRNIDMNPDTSMIKKTLIQIYQRGRILA